MGTSHEATACPLCRVIAAGTGHAGHIATLEECVVILGENQGTKGWCVLVLKEHVEHLGVLPLDRQQRVFGEVARVAGAIRATFATSGRNGAPPRINYECLGNVVAHVHWHVIPRHADDPTPTAPVWGWGGEKLRGTLGAQERDALVAKLRAALRG
jgi:diadenosine tetraphosphate (Ap4A) HIT family hydrolase